MIIFAGPSLNETSHTLLEVGGHDLRLPVRRGDIRRCLRETTPGTLAVVDGVFHQILAVGHEELLDAIAAGWEVWGLSSMGAIRAYELRDFGMKGFGKVYAKFFEFKDFQDDELALLYASEHPYRAFSEPLVHIRVCVEHLVAQGLLAEAAGRDIIERMKVLYFGDRTLESLGEMLVDHGVDAEMVIGQFGNYRVKHQDLVNFLQSRQNNADEVA